MPEESVTLRIFRGDAKGGEHVEYTVPRQPGMVVLDAIHAVQQMHSPDLAVRWNCKAGKCGSCSGEVNGKPKLMCMDRIDNYADGDPITVSPLKTFPLIKDLATDVSWNFEQKKKIAPLKPADPNNMQFQQHEADRVQEFRKCIECYLCQDVCHVLRDHQKFDEFSGPRFMIRAAEGEMHPLDTEDRREAIRNTLGIGYCNITKCCTEVCPESIHITDNGIIPLKERVVDRYYDPLQIAWRKLTGKRYDTPQNVK